MRGNFFSKKFPLHYYSNLKLLLQFREQRDDVQTAGKELVESADEEAVEESRDDRADADADESAEEGVGHDEGSGEAGCVEEILELRERDAVPEADPLDEKVVDDRQEIRVERERDGKRAEEHPDREEEDAHRHRKRGGRRHGGIKQRYQPDKIEHRAVDEARDERAEIDEFHAPHRDAEDQEQYSLHYVFALPEREDRKFLRKNKGGRDDHREPEIGGSRDRHGKRQKKHTCEVDRFAVNCDFFRCHFYARKLALLQKAKK